jgi:hypothetical protein
MEPDEREKADKISGLGFLNKKIKHGSTFDKLKDEFELNKIEGAGQDDLKYLD